MVAIIFLETHLVPYGVTLFCIAPILIAYIVHRQSPMLGMGKIIAVSIGLGCFFSFLYVGGFQSLFCIFTSLLLIGMLFGLGYLLWRLFGWHKKKFKKSNHNTIQLYVGPLLLLILSGAIERFFTEKYVPVEVSTSLSVPYPSEVVFDAIKSVDTLAGESPFLFHVGVQRPLKCVLEREAVGAKRTCYFKEGTIEEEVTEIARGRLLKMKILNYGMPGRQWLHFQEAIYLFKAHGDSTTLTRITTYETELKPRSYWEFWERLAIETEHRFVLEDLKQRLEKKGMP